MSERDIVVGSEQQQVTREINHRGRELMPRLSRLASMPIAKIFELRDEIAEHLVQRRKALEIEMAQLEKHAAGARRAAGARKGTSAGRPSPLVGRKVAVKYRGPKPGQTWTGRGMPPRWMEGKDPAKFLISKPAVAVAHKRVARKSSRKPGRKVKAAKRKG
jgi:DNA-binding protein H-NS